MPRKKSPPNDEDLGKIDEEQETEFKEEPLEKPVKSKKERSPKQIEAFKKMQNALNEKKKAKAQEKKEDKDQTIELLKALDVIKKNSNEEKVQKIKSNDKVVESAKRTIKGRGRPEKVKLATPEPSSGEEESEGEESISSYASESSDAS